MFKRAINSFFEYNVWERIVALMIVFAILIFGYDVFFNDVFNIFSQDEAVYSHFNELATDVIEQKSTDFLENSDILKYYTVTENSKENTITVSFFGYHTEELELVLSTDYTLVEMNRPLEGITLVIAITFTCIIVYVMAGFITSLILNVILAASKYIYERWLIEYWIRLRDYFISLREKAKRVKFKEQLKVESTHSPKYMSEDKPTETPEAEQGSESETDSGR